MFMHIGRVCIGIDNTSLLKNKTKKPTTTKTNNNKTTKTTSTTAEHNNSNKNNNNKNSRLSYQSQNNDQCNVSYFHLLLDILVFKKACFL
jgi:hypothetical protein